jgi:hypothetical protein
MRTQSTYLSTVWTRRTFAQRLLWLDSLSRGGRASSEGQQAGEKQRYLRNWTFSARRGRSQVSRRVRPCFCRPRKRQTSNKRHEWGPQGRSPEDFSEAIKALIVKSDHTRVDVVEVVSVIHVTCCDNDCKLRRPLPHFVLDVRSSQCLESGA